MSNESVQMIYPSEEMVKNAAVSGMDAYRALWKRMQTIRSSGPNVPVK